MAVKDGRDETFGITDAVPDNDVEVNENKPSKVPVNKVVNEPCLLLSSEDRAEGDKEAVLGIEEV